MLKVIGVFMIMIGSSGYGMRLYLDLKDGIWHINCFIRLLEVVISEINYRNLSLPECLRMQAEHAGEPYKSIYKEVYRCYEEDGRCDIATCFRSKLEEGLVRVPLTASEKEIVEGLFEEMPIYDPEMQIKLLAGKKQQLEKILLKRENELAEKKKLYTTLGVMVGLLLILILI